MTSLKAGELVETGQMARSGYGFAGSLRFVPKVSRIIDAVIAWVLSLRLMRAWLLYSERKGPALADGITYRALFSVFAAVLLGFSVAGLWLAGNPAAFDALVNTVNSAIPGLLAPDGPIDVSSIQVPVGLSLAGIVSLVGLVGAALGAISSLRTALRTLATTIADDTFWLWVTLRNLALALGIGASLLLSAALAVAGSELLQLITQQTNVSESSPLIEWGTRLGGIALIFVLDTALIAGLFVVLAGVKAPPRALWSGALLGALGLVVLQELSSLFIGGAMSNPLLATFASLIALLLWLNLSAQVVLYASAYIITAVNDASDFGAGLPRTFAQHHLRNIERLLVTVRAERDGARAAVRKEEKKAQRMPRASEPRK